MLVFVYGTLKNGESNHGFIEGSKFVGHHVLMGYRIGTYTTVYPFITRGIDTDFVHGEVYEINEDQLKWLDGLEGTPHHYTRETISYEGNECFVYVLNNNLFNTLNEVKWFPVGNWNYK